MQKLAGSFRSLWTEMLHSGKHGWSLRWRLLAFLSFLIITVVFGFLLLMMSTGAFDSGRAENGRYLQNELSQTAQNIAADCGKLARQGIALSEQLSGNIEKLLRAYELTPGQLAERPELLETVLDSQVANLLAAVRSAKSSGIFLILDATVNPALEHSAYSRAGLYLKSTEPNIVNSVDPNVRYLYGPAGIARANGIDLLPQWKQEFSVEDYRFFPEVLENARRGNRSLSRLYYWSERLQISGNGEAGMLLAVPLVARDGTVFGVCGFELSAMLFKLAYSPDNTNFPRIFSAMAPLGSGQSLNLNQGLIAGNYYMMNHLAGGDVAVQSEQREATVYRSENGTVFCGGHCALSLYPSDSCYADEQWAVGLLIPEEEYVRSVSSHNGTLLLCVFVILLVSLAMAVYISRRYLKPIVGAINDIKTETPLGERKTKILEIDDLVEFLRQRDEEAARRSPEPAEKSSSATGESFDAFRRNMQTLSPAEKNVFALYMQGLTAPEIADRLCLSINTIKTHNRHIYEKMNVSSRKELMLYLKMLEQKGQAHEIPAGRP